MRKLRQITDSVHRTIYLSEFESLLISTPFYNRLHDVYQSSTVYLTFPSNRTKRYEHSLGVMHLTSIMFFSAVANSTRDIRDHFFSALNNDFTTILGALKSQTTSRFYHKIENTIARSIKELSDENKLNRAIIDAMKHEAVSDLALGHFIPNCFFPCEDDGNNVFLGTTARKMFLYQCSLQAMRIAALFHDVGHPPYSHIIESIIVELYNKCKQKNNYNQERAKELVESLEQYFNKEKFYNDGFRIKPKTSEDKSQEQRAFHEQVGLVLFQVTIEQCVSNLLNQIKKANDTDADAEILYYITVIEFAFAIMSDRTPFFASLHKIIDGSIDTDRLDYIVRDTMNSGVNWGRIPFERIIESVMLTTIDINCQNKFGIAFPRKITDDIDDVFMTRYKILTRINSHHRSIKTASLLQEAIKALAISYLSNKGKKDDICPDIRKLWTDLAFTIGDNERVIKVAQWNDSWLISVLYDAYIKLNEPGYLQKGNKRIATLLEEVLHNTKHYYSVLKRKGDAIDLAEKVIRKACLTKEVTNEVRVHELQKLNSSINPMNGPDATILRDNTRESLRRLLIIDKFLENADFELLSIVFPINVKDIITKKLETIKNQKTIISDYMIIDNKSRDKIGLPKNGDQIYLHDNKTHIHRYNPSSTLVDQINALRTTCLGFYIYVDLTISNKDPHKKVEKVLEGIATAIGEEIKRAFVELYPDVAINWTDD